MKKLVLYLATLICTLAVPQTVKAVDLVDFYYTLQPQAIQEWGNEAVDICVKDEVFVRGESVLAGTFCEFDDEYHTSDISIELTKGNEYCVLHEMGHAIDSKNGPIEWSNTNLFKAIYNAEKGNNKEYKLIANALDSPMEYFAESYSLYILDGRGLYETNPMTYSYIDAVVNMF